MRIAIYSTMSGQPWGGSEELWSRTAHALLARRHYVSVNVKHCRQLAPALVNLRKAGADVHRRRGLPLGRTLRRALKAVGLARQPSLKWLKRCRPDFALVSIGLHLDDLSITQTCRSLGIPYALLLQAASPYAFVDPRNFDPYRAAWAGAAKCFFVSDQNRQVVETDLALDLSDGQIIDNPFQVSPAAQPAWPTDGKTWKLACIARIHFPSKGQDLLLRVLRLPKWRARPIQASLFGADGGSLRQVQELITLHSQHKQVVIRGFAKNVEDVWREHHALVLPSRYEGNPLAMIEAMICGRVPIVTDVGRASELIDDNVAGFVAPAATVELLDDALERAWQRRHEWQAMGQLAAATIRQRHSLQPAEDFADRLLAAATGQQQQAPNLARAAA
ncbi:MAG: glycosyltransferase family 4 protein [Pirellulales bacterium]|nr:glycosyltransferase family 4 protein [Pirellulales bacterium]